MCVFRFAIWLKLRSNSTFSQVFLSLQSGVIKTYDLECHKRSPYVVPNLWSLYENKIMASDLRKSNANESYEIHSPVMFGVMIVY